jgi:DMSO/TMAO reductase YedYZ molybdopterin-dependent catalytic subunit
MRKEYRLKNFGAGLLIGLTAAVLMTFSLLTLRYAFGIATPSELVGDRVAPSLGVFRFLEMLERFGSYNRIKQFSVMSVIGGQLLVGVIGGVIYHFIAGRNASRGGGRRALTFIFCFVIGLWLLSVGLLWPALGAQYTGAPLSQGTMMTTLALLFSYGVYGVAVIFSHRMLIKRAMNEGAARAERISGRRAAAVGAAGFAFALASVWLLRRFYALASFSYDGTEYKGADVQAITPNERFYVVTKNVVDPDVRLGLWRLEVTGRVRQVKNYSFEDLQNLPSVTQETTLRCISNEVGGGLTSNAIWKGTPLRALIDSAGPQEGVMEVLLHAVDGYTDTLSFTKAMEPTTVVAYEMNGQPLPTRHGYPARIIAPGLFGEKNLKWVTRIELVDHDVKGFYELQGWGPNFVMPTMSRIDQPYNGQKINLASAMSGVSFKGIAHAGDRGISKVEVSVDGEATWRETEIRYATSPLAWALWDYDWKPERPGNYTLVVRATDGAGARQIKETRPTVPEGATGYHRIVVTIEA